MLARLSAIVPLILLIGLPVSASARLPDFKNNRITAKSIGGVRVGMSLGQAKAAWGPGGYDYDVDAPCGADTVTCTWRQTRRVNAHVTIDNNRVERILIAGSRRSRPGRLRTRAGYRLGTKGEVFFRRGCQSSPVGLDAPVSAGAAYTCSRVTFYVARRSGRTIAIQVG